MIKREYHHIALVRICGWFGLTRQAYYQNQWRQIECTIEEELVIKRVLEIRRDHRKLGGRKLYLKLKSFMIEHQIKMGRDAFFDLLSVNDLLVKRRKRKVSTTNSFHWLRKYPNLIREFIPTEPNQLWVSDITYWKCGSFFLYISLITDAYSRMIVGYHVDETLESAGTIKALQNAINKDTKNLEGLVHHSDRGVQYCSGNYVELLKKNKIKISMTENGDPLENAIAERVNGILKNEYLIDENVSSTKQARVVLDRTIELYNNDRPHMSISNYVPKVVHENQAKNQPERLWKNYYKKRPTSELEGVF